MIRMRLILYRQHCFEIMRSLLHAPSSFRGVMNFATLHPIQIRLFAFSVLFLALALSACGSREDLASAPCQSDEACRGARICHEGRCRFEEEVRRELALEGVIEPDETGTIDLSGEDDPALDPEHPAFVESAIFTPTERQFMGGPAHTGQSPHAGPVEPPTARFTIRTGGRITASPILAEDGTAFVGSLDRHFFAVSSEGKLRFRHRASGRVYAAAAAMKDGTIVFGSDDGYITALTPLGQTLFRVRVKGSILSSITLDEHENIIVAADGIFAFDREGNELFHYETASQIRSAPSVHPDGMILFGTVEGTVVALDSDGRLLFETSVGSSVIGGVAVARDGSFYVGTALGHLVGLDERGREFMRFATNAEIRGTPAIAPDGTILVGSYDQHVYAIERDGTLRFRFAANGRIRSSIRVDSEGHAYFGAQDGFLYAIDSEGGLLFRVNIGADVDTSPAIAADGTLYLGADDGVLHALR